MYTILFRYFLPFFSSHYLFLFPLYFLLHFAFPEDTFASLLLVCVWKAITLPCYYLLVIWVFLLHQHPCFGNNSPDPGRPLLFRTDYYSVFYNFYAFCHLHDYAACHACGGSEVFCH